MFSRQSWTSSASKSTKEHGFNAMSGRAFLASSSDTFTPAAAPAPVEALPPAAAAAPPPDDRNPGLTTGADGFDTAAGGAAAGAGAGAPVRCTRRGSALNPETSVAHTAITRCSCVRTKRTACTYGRFRPFARGGLIIGLALGTRRRHQVRKALIRIWHAVPESPSVGAVAVGSVSSALPRTGRRGRPASPLRSPCAPMPASCVSHVARILRAVAHAQLPSRWSLGRRGGAHHRRRAALSMSRGALYVRGKTGGQKTTKQKNTGPIFSDRLFVCKSTVEAGPAENGV